MREKINKGLNIMLALFSLTYIIEGIIEMFSPQTLEQGILRIFAGLLVLLCWQRKRLYITEQKEHENTKQVLNKLIDAIYEEEEKD